jgi:gluconokinase
LSELLPRFYVVMGVSGCGKTTVGQAVAAQLNCPFYDADDFHPQENIAKMASGVPLDDDDRAPWLARLAGLIADHLARGETAVLACSALKRRYREQLRGENGRVQFLYLRGDFDTIWQRMQARPGHYMKAEMLQSQFDALEEPSQEEAAWIDISETVSRIVDAVLLSQT